MTTYQLARSPRSPRSTATPGPCLTTRPAASAFIAMMFGLAVLAFLLGLLALSM